jgi:hypothetical protein
MLVKEKRLQGIFEKVGEWRLGSVTLSQTLRVDGELLHSYDLPYT